MSEPLKIWLLEATSPHIAGSALKTWARPTVESDGGLLPTPTRKANVDAPSMLKWEAHRRHSRWKSGLGMTKTTPEAWEWMMGVPIGWTECTPLATHKFLKWLRSH